MSILPFSSRSEVLLNGIDRLVDQILATKTDSFSERIVPQIDKYLGIERKDVAAPGTESTQEEIVPVAGTKSATVVSSEAKFSKTQQSMKPSGSPQSHSASHVMPKTVKSPSQQHLNLKVNEKKEVDQNVRKQQNESSAKQERNPTVQSKGSIEPTESSSQKLPTDSSGSKKVSSIQNQNKKECSPMRVCDSSDCKGKVTPEITTACLKPGKESDGNKLRKGFEKGTARPEKNENFTESHSAEGKQEKLSNVMQGRTDVDDISKLMQSSNQLKSRNEAQSPRREQKLAKTSETKNCNENKLAEKGVEESLKENDSISKQFKHDATFDANRTACAGTACGSEDREANRSIVDAKVEDGDENKKKDESENAMSNTNSSAVKTEKVEIKETVKKEKTEPIMNAQSPNRSTEKLKETVVKKEVERVSEDSKKAPQSDKEYNLQIKKGKDSKGIEKDSHCELQQGSHSNDGMINEDLKDIKDRCEPKTTESKGLERNTEKSCQPENSFATAIVSSADESCETELQDTESVSSEVSLRGIDESGKTTPVDQSATHESQTRVGQRRVKRRKRLISEDEKAQISKSAKVDENESSQVPQINDELKMQINIEDSKPKKGRGRPRKPGSFKSDSQHSSDSELAVEESQIDALGRGEPGKGRYRKQEETSDSRGLKRQRSIGSESNASDSCIEDKDIETNRRTKRQIKPKRCYSPSDGK